MRLQHHPLITSARGRGTWLRLGEAQLRPWLAKDLSRLMMPMPAPGTSPFHLQAVVIEADYWHALQDAGIAGNVAATLARFLEPAAGLGRPGDKLKFNVKSRNRISVLRPRMSYGTSLRKSMFHQNLILGSLQHASARP